MKKSLRHLFGAAIMITVTAFTIGCTKIYTPANKTSSSQNTSAPAANTTNNQKSADQKPTDQTPSTSSDLPIDIPGDYADLIPPGFFQ
ncbi:MAG: hypothetical protein LBL35_06780 [Clostridiales bacterium]|jgi:hypothetical protein|nr:hypothetical protein [Clostridiales bacterium]